MYQSRWLCGESRERCPSNMMLGGIHFASLENKMSFSPREQLLPFYGLSSSYDVSNDQDQESRRCSEEAGYLHEQLRRIGWYAKHTPSTSTVMLRCPPKEVCERFGLEVDRSYATVYVFPHMIRPDLDELIAAVERAACD